MTARAHDPKAGIYEGRDFSRHDGPTLVFIRDEGDATTIRYQVPGMTEETRYVRGSDDAELGDCLDLLASQPHQWTVRVMDVHAAGSS